MYLVFSVFINLFVAVLHAGFLQWWRVGVLLTVVHGLLITVAYLTLSAGLERRLGSWHTDLVSEAHGVFLDHTHDPCPGRRIVNHWTTRKSLYT